MRCVSYDADELQKANGRTARLMPHCCILRRCIYLLVTLARDSSRLQEGIAWATNDGRGHEAGGLHRSRRD